MEQITVLSPLLNRNHSDVDVLHKTSKALLKWFRNDTIRFFKGPEVTLVWIKFPSVLPKCLWATLWTQPTYSELETLKFVKQKQRKCFLTRQQRYADDVLCFKNGGTEKHKPEIYWSGPEKMYWHVSFPADTAGWPISEHCCYGKTLLWGIWGSQEWAGWVTNTQLKVNLKNKQRSCWITEEKR